MIQKPPFQFTAKQSSRCRQTSRKLRVSTTQWRKHCRALEKRLKLKGGLKKHLTQNLITFPAHLTYGKMLARNETRLEEAESWFRRAKRIAPTDAAVYQHYGQFLASQRRHAEAAESFVTANALTPNDYEIVVGAANSWRQAEDNQRAEIYYKKAVALRPQEARAHMNLGAILHLNRKYAETQQSYLTALHLKPHDSMTLENL